MSSRRLARDAELLQARGQCRASEGEARRDALRPPDHPIGFSEDPEDAFAFDLFEGADQGWRSFGKSAPRQLVRCQTKGWPGRQDDGPFDDVLEFPYIPRPIIVREGVQRLGGDHVDMLVQVPRVVAHEVVYQQGNILRQLAQSMCQLKASDRKFCERVTNGWARNAPSQPSTSLPAEGLGCSIWRHTRPPSHRSNRVGRRSRRPCTRPTHVSVRPTIRPSRKPWPRSRRLMPMGGFDITGMAYSNLKTAIG